MAIVKAGAGALKMDQLGLSVDGEVQFSRTNVRVTFDDDDFIDFGGTYAPTSTGGFTGTTTSITETEDGRVRFSVTDANADANTLFNLLDSGNVIGAAAYVLREDDRIVGRGRDDNLFGFSGNDRIYGGDGTDLLIGGSGADRLYGEGEGDTFRYLSTAESTVARSGRDTIYGFSGAEGDRIDLAAIDAITGNDTNDTFTLTNRFHGVAGELIVRSTNAGFLVLGDTDGVDGADFAILVKGDIAPGANDFVL